MRYRLRICAAAATLMMVGTAPTRAAPIVFDFEDQDFGAVTPLTITRAGVSATFASPDDAAGFQISGAFFQTLVGNYLQSPGPDGVTGSTLTIRFSKAVRSISLGFAVDTQPAPAPLVLTTDKGGTASASGTVPGGFFLYPEGTLGFNAAPFHSVTLATSALSFAIDNVSVEALPEPSALAILGLGLLGAGVVRRRSTRNS